MYYPYFRGKQYELIAIRETAEALARAHFVPIIEPVKGTLTNLDRALKAVHNADGKAIVIVNPYYGDLAEDGEKISSLLKNSFPNSNNIIVGILLKETTSLKDAWDIYQQHMMYTPTFIHAGFKDAKNLAIKLGTTLKQSSHVFFEKHCGKVYRRHFYESYQVLLRDGFHKLRNAEYEKIPVEIFSDLHVTFREEGMNGFGDFLIVGDDYSERGGPAYAVAIHLTFVDPMNEDVMYIYHFVSSSNDTPTDPGGKFSQALDKLISKLNSGNSKLFESSAIKEFRELYENSHFPGLGSVKKLSMLHHIETLVDFFS